jgi:beta-galactosidase/beta-glucuronidase
VVSIHRIRLLGPWDFVWHETPGSVAPPLTQGSVKMPCRWDEVFGTVSGTATFTRKFHCPTNLDPQERVCIVLSGLPGRGTVAINGELLGEFDQTHSRTELDVTKRLNKFNQLAIEVSFSPSANLELAEGLLAEVALEIHSS